MYYIPQLNDCDCGFACLKMLLATVHQDENYLFLKQDENHGKYSYQELLLIAQRYEVTMMGATINDKDDLRHFSKFPMILTVNIPNHAPHALLLTQRKGNRVKVHDPAKGVYWCNVNKIIPYWDGTFMGINHVEKCPYPYPIIDMKDRQGMVVSSIFQALAAGFIAAATFFVKPGGSYLLAIIFASLSLISEVILRFVLLKRMQKGDKYLRRFLQYVPSNDYYEYYKRSQEYKRCSLSMSVNLVFSLLIVIMVVAISLINSLNYIILIIASLIGAYLDAFVFTPFKNEVNKTLTKQENDLKMIRDIDGVELQVKNMEVKAYRYAYYEFAKKIVVVVLLMIASVALSISQKNFTITNVIFSFCLSLLLYQSLVPLFNYDYRVEENLLCKARINNVVHLDEIDSKKH